ncbi:hypothetical protein QJS10_CPB18g00768 [Acorus calamus]|uniref:Uncharacterized protein n=1 Tax=Acorus calamus TaxID=4465 RepID=A0AAV9CPN9_ACOCL|nr:hypothetical protein QJS10_CPB18g00768 [Acorus calamus]
MAACHRQRLHHHRQEGTSSPVVAIVGELVMSDRGTKELKMYPRPQSVTMLFKKIENPPIYKSD